MLFDAMIVIDLHRSEQWSDVVSQLDVTIPSVVVDESKYEDVDPGGFPLRINIQEDIDSGRVKVESASMSELKATESQFADWFWEKLGAGEREALSLMRTCRCADVQLCSSDGLAIQGAVMLGFRDRCICLSQVLRSIGMTISHGKYSEDFLRNALKVGGEKLIRGYGLR